MEQQATTLVTGEPFVIAGWRVDPATLRISQADKIEKLEPKVMAVLEYLATRQGKAVSRQELEEEIWSGTVVGYDAISNAIIKLRKAFGDSAQNDAIIETIPKTGYRLIAAVTPATDDEASGAVIETEHNSPADGRIPPAQRTALNWRMIFDWRVAAYFMIIVMIAVTFWLEPWGTRVEPASIEEMELPLPDKPSIAVLPFSNLSADPEQEYFVDGMTDDLIIDLSKLSGLFVVARNSVFTYKGKSIKVKQVAEDLGVRYVLEGSVRRAGVRVRINVQLIDALSGDHVWAETFDGVFDDVFALQDKITHGIVEQLAVHLSLEDSEALARIEGVTAEANDLFLRGWGQYRAGTARDHASAVRFFRQALAVDSEFARAKAALAAVYWNILRQGWYLESLGVPYYRSSKLAKLALKQSQENPTALTYQIASESIAYYSSSPRRALAEAETAIELDPNDPAGHLALGNALLKAKKPKAAEQSIRSAMRLDPHYPAYYLVRLAQAQFHLEQYEAAAESLETATARVPEDDWAWLYLAATYGLLSQIDKAGKALEQADQLRANQGWGPVTQRVVSSKLFRWQGGKKKFKAGLKVAGVATGGEWFSLVKMITRTDGEEGKVYEIEGVPVIDVVEAKSMHERGVVFVDVLNTWITGHIPAAHFLELWREHPESGLFNEASLGKVAAKDQEIVIYDANSEYGHAAKACAMAVSRGFTKVFYFRGGTGAWLAAGYPVEKAASDEF